MKRHLFRIEYFGEEPEKDLLLEVEDNIKIDDIFEKITEYKQIISKGKCKQIINFNWDKIKSIKYVMSTNI